jgi:N,N'-diacetyllegionaminate synthase
MKIIAEIGSNWRSLNDCLNSIALAKACGADAVKFQAYDWRSLYGFGAVLNPHELNLRGILDPAWLPTLKAKADSVDIEFMCSAFSVPLLNEVDKYVSTHKVASAELTHIRILERLREIGKPVILSTGASSMNDIAIALKVLGDTPVTLLYCVSAYPANYVNFRKIDLLRMKFLKPVGYSDHSTDAIVIPMTAKMYGATVIEKHVNLVGVKDTPDAPHSLNTDQFKAMCNALIEEDGYRSLPLEDDSERDMFTTHNRRLIATRDIKAGEHFKENENFGIFRALKPDTKALSPWAIDKVNGHECKIDIKAGDGIPPEAL